MSELWRDKVVIFLLGHSVVEYFDMSLLLKIMLQVAVHSS